MTESRNKAGHTPGPWKLREYGQIISTDNVRSHEGVIAEVQRYGTASETRQNEHLIAAAPETAAERDRLRAERDALLAALKAARIEIDEAADKMHVLGLNHPGGLWPGGQLDQDKAFMAELAERFRNASKAADAAIDLAEGLA